MTDGALLPAAGRVAAISGAGRGLGAAITRRLHAEGFALAVGVRDPARRIALPEGARVTWHRYDAAAPDSAASWIAEAVAAHGRLDVLVNNAGILRPFTLEQGDEADLDAMWAVNVKGPLRAIRAALPHLRAAGHGRLVNIASTDGKRIRDPSAPLGYAMTKHALMALTHAARFAGHEDGLRATALCPGAIDTELIAGLPGATPAAGRMKPETVAEIVGLILRLPNQAAVAELIVNTRLESTL
ncbi:MAG TPA: SDR family NAD(P)-dependent oxidoreductase [Falsiroseomonas sp.]|jgi:NAD(P)-dependent dehydrogenase (short-subunit alcohol dehydrogenase family)|nr:SDR family NAD(P)-dependent oxidoreductase [Falsiroseomonas sp.]